MTISVAGSLIQDPNDLSPLGRLALAFVDGGLQWLEWAITHPSARYDFADETTLVGAVQQGIHASPFALLPQLGIIVSPIKLMTLGLPDLRVVAKAEEGDDSEIVAAQLRRILGANRILTQADLAAGVTQLGQWGVAGAPVFQVMGFHDREALCELLHFSAGPDASTPAMQQEAASFAVEQARTPREFADYYKLYLGLTAKQAAPATTPDQRNTFVANALQALLPLLFKALDCPEVNGLPSPDQVAAAVNDWLAQGKRLGFARLSEGAQQLVEGSAYQGETGDAAARLVHLYLDTAQAFLASTQPQRALMGQDGATCRFSLQSGDQQGELELGSAGIISLRRFGPKPAPAAATASDQS